MNLTYFLLYWKYDFALIYKGKRISLTVFSLDLDYLIQLPMSLQIYKEYKKIVYCKLQNYVSERLHFIIIVIKDTAKSFFFYFNLH